MFDGWENVNHVQEPQYQEMVGNLTAVLRHQFCRPPLRTDDVAIAAPPMKLVLVKSLKSDDPVGNAPAVDVGTTVQLAVSPKIIAQAGTGLKRTMQRPSDLRTVISADAPWEQGFAIGVLGTSIVDRGGGHLQLWYSLRNRTLVNKDVDWGGSSSDTSHRILQAYATSSDFGGSWVKPLLHRFWLGNSSANNVKW